MAVRGTLRQTVQAQLAVRHVRQEIDVERNGESRDRNPDHLPRVQRGTLQYSDALKLGRMNGDIVSSHEYDVDDGDDDWNRKRIAYGSVS